MPSYRRRFLPRLEDTPADPPEAPPPDGGARVVHGPPGRPREQRTRSPIVSPSAPVPAVVGDDHPVVRAGIRAILEDAGLVEVVAEAADGQALVELVESYRPSIVITDVAMPVLGGIEATRLICQRDGAPPVLIFSRHGTQERVLDALEAGASGYVLKDCAPRELQDAVRAVLDGGAYFSSSVARLLADLRGGVRSGPKLTVREREIVQLLSEGWRLETVAHRLFISVATVKSHRAHAMRKLGLRTTAQLVRYAITYGLCAD